MGMCSGKFLHTESRSAQTEISPMFGYSSGELINARYHNYKPLPMHSRVLNQKPRRDTIQMKSTILNDWKYPGRYDPQSVDVIPQVPPEKGRYKMDHNKGNGDTTPTLSGVWPINGIGDSNTNNIRNKRNNHFSQSRLHLNNEMEKSNVNVNDGEEFGNKNLFNDINNIYDCQYNLDLSFDNIKEDVVNKMIRKNYTLRPNGNKELKRIKSLRKVPVHRPKSGNNNSNNYSLPINDKSANNPINPTQKNHSSNLLDQDSYPIQYTFYVDDNDICTKPFYDRRMIAIAKTCRCRIYFHAKADETEKPLYYKGKPVRPVTITSPDMACLKRCLGSIDSQFPYFNCKAFLSLSS